MNYQEEWVKELMHGLYSSPKSTRLTLRNELGKTYEKSSIRAKFAFMTVAPEEVLNLQLPRRTKVLDALFFTACVYSSYHTKDNDTPKTTVKMEKILSKMYHSAESESSQKMIENILGQKDARLYKTIQSILRRNTGMEVDEYSLACDLLYWDDSRKSYTDADGVEHLIIPVQEKWAMAIVKVQKEN